MAAVGAPMTPVRPPWRGDALRVLYQEEFRSAHELLVDARQWLLALYLLQCRAGCPDEVLRATRAALDSTGDLADGFRDLLAATERRGGAG